MKQRFIEDHRHRYGVKVLCEVLQVSRSGCYAARCRAPSARRQRQMALTARIREIHAASRETYGAARVHAELQAQSVPCCRNTVAKLMRQAQIVPRAIRRFRITTDSRNTQASADLVRFAAQQPNQCWLSDVTYIPTRGGLAVSGRGPGSVLPGCGRLGDESHAGHAAGHRCSGHGAAAAWPRPGDPAF